MKRRRSAGRGPKQGTDDEEIHRGQPNLQVDLVESSY